MNELEQVLSQIYKDLKTIQKERERIEYDTLDISD